MAKRSSKAAAQQPRAAAIDVSAVFERHRTRIVFGLLLVLVLYGGYIRFHQLSRESLWIDELWTWQIADKPTLNDVVWHSRLQHDVHPPLHFVMHYYLQKYVGDSESILRAPSAVAGVLTVVAMFLLGRRLYSDTEGLIAAAVTAVALFPIHYSREARSYVMLALFVVLSAYFWVAVMQKLCARKRANGWELAGYIATATIAACLHYFGILIIALQGIAAAALLAWRRPKALLFQPLVYVPIVVHYLWWWPVMKRSLGLKSFWIKKPGWDAFYDYTFTIFSRSDWITWGVLVVYAWAVGAMLYRMLRTRRRAPAAPDDGGELPLRDLLLVCWLVVPFAIAFIRSITATPVLTEKNLIISMPAAYLLVARGVTLIPIRRWAHVLIGVLIAATLTLHFFFGFCYYRHLFNDQFRQGVQLVVTHRGQAEESLVIGYSFGHRFFDYYFDRMNTDKKLDLWAGEEKDIPIVAGAVEERRPKYIYLLWGHRAPERVFYNFIFDEKKGLCRYYERTVHRALFRVHVFLFTRKDIAAQQRPQQQKR